MRYSFLQEADKGLFMQPTFIPFLKSQRKQRSLRGSGEVGGLQMSKPNASGLTLIVGLGRVPVTRSQVMSWQRRVAGSLGRQQRPFGR